MLANQPRSVSTKVRGRSPIGTRSCVGPRPVGPERVRRLQHAAGAHADTSNPVQPQQGARPSPCTLPRRRMTLRNLPLSACSAACQPHLSAHSRFRAVHQCMFLFSSSAVTSSSCSSARFRKHWRRMASEKVHTCWVPWVLTICCIRSRPRARHSNG